MCFVVRVHSCVVRYYTTLERNISLWLVLEFVRHVVEHFSEFLNFKLTQTLKHWTPGKCVNLDNFDKIREL